MRKAKKEDFVGKTIKSIDLDASNSWTIEFTDGSRIFVWAEVGTYEIPNLLVSDPEDMK